MKKTITATCQTTGSKIVSRHCFPDVVEKMSAIVGNEAKSLIGSDNYEIDVSDKIEF